MARIINDTVSRFVNPTSPRDSIAVRVVAILAAASLTVAEALEGVGLEMDPEWSVHRDLPEVGEDTLIVATRTDAS